MAAGGSGAAVRGETVLPGKKEYLEREGNRLLQLWLLIACLTGCFIFLALALLDYYAAPGHFHHFLRYRVAISAFLLLIVFLTRRTKGKLALLLLTYLAIVASAVTIELMILAFGGHRSPYYVGQILLAVCALSVLPAGTLFNSAAAFSIELIYVVPILATERITDFPAFFTSNFFLVAILSTSLLMRHMSYSSLQGEIALRYEVLRHESELERAVADRTAALSDAVKSLQGEILDRLHVEESLRKATEDLRLSNEELKKIDVMKDGLIRDVTHELKTPVAKHAMQIEILKAALANRGLLAEMRGTIEVMEAGVRRQQQVIRNLLDLSRLEAGGRKYRCEEFRLDELAREVLEQYGDLLQRHGITARVSGECGIRSDRELLLVVFSNIVDNAIKYRTRTKPPLLEIVVGLTATGCELRCTDNGIGMEQSVLVRAMDRFYQASPSSEGSGVGLAIVKAVVESLGGSVTLLSSGKDQGMSVIVGIPRQPPPKQNGDAM